MKKPILPLLGLMLFAFSTLAQEKLTINANMPELTDGDPVYLWNAFTKTSDSTYVKNNSFSFSVDVPNGASTFILQAGVNPEKTGLGMFMLMQTGKLNIEGGNGTGFKGAKLTGDAFVSDWLEMEKAMAPADEKLNQIQDLNADFNEARKLGDKSAADAIAKEMGELRKEVAKIGRDFLDQHPTSSASAYVLNAILPDAFSAMEKIEYLSKLSGNALNGVSKKMLMGLTGSETPWIGKQAPDFSQPDVNGKMVSLKDFKGKYVLVDFWASWCTPCRGEAPQLKAIYEKVKDKNISFVSISLDKDKSKWTQAMLEDKMPWQQLSDLVGEQNAAAKAFNVGAVPAKFLIDPSGKVIGVGFKDGSETGKVLEKFLNEHLK
ncbi:TlpA family protein disulfide reductase [Pedobacter rhizosphaerae]|uniref:Peroxiredoxin n=1 Tax=Pedobacter rhizosphaerae TaxID=390241 RepID=A0A1H9KR59_9SPHI|nr:TlpA disulfide reductase family protein [Pedobacter rhizosphaerae]SER01640.1 Peroxiredoxin [Pedobacter rhizosphaerae]